MSLISSIGLGPRPSPTPSPTPSPEPTPTDTTTTSGSGSTTETRSTSSPPASSTQDSSSSNTGGSSQTSEPSVTYQPSPPQAEPVTYSPTPSANAQTSAPIASTPEAAPARFSISNRSSGSITEQVASVVPPTRPELRSQATGEAPRPDVTELVAAFAKQFAGTERRNLEMIL